MAKFGARYLQWAPFAAVEADVDDAAFPKYGKPMNLGPLVAVTDTINVVEAENHGDDELQEYASEFQKLTVDVEITELPQEVAAVLYGAEIGADGGDLELGNGDDAPWGGLAFYTSKQTNVGGVQKKFFEGVYYPKLKASVQGATYNTKGQSITFANGKVHFTGTTCAKGKYKVLSKNFETAAEAKAWVDAKIAEYTGD